MENCGLAEVHLRKSTHFLVRKTMTGKTLNIVSLIYLLPKIVMNYDWKNLEHFNYLLKSLLLKLLNPMGKNIWRLFWTPFYLMEEKGLCYINPLPYTLQEEPLQ